MQEVLKKMSHEEKEKYKNFISEFTAAMKVFSGVQQAPEGFYEEIEKKVKEYIEFMKPFTEKEIPKNLGNQSIKFFVLQEVHHLYSMR